MNSDYSDDFDELEDDEEIGYEEADDTETLSERITRHNTTITDIRTEYRKFSNWFDGMLAAINAECRQKTLVCLALTESIRSRAKDDDTAKLWCICVSEHSDFIFENPAEIEEEYALYNFMALMDDVDDMMSRLKNEDVYFDKFRSLTENITFGDKLCTDFDFTDFIGAFLEEADDSDAPLKDNLENAVEMVSHSPELSQIMPVVFYAIFMRYPKKMYKTEGFEPNFTKLLSRKEYIIDSDNGKNIANFYRHLDCYRSLSSHFDCCDKKLCDIGFASLSNITECDLLVWEDYPEIKRPLSAEILYGIFSCFPLGYNDNPYFAANEIDIKYLNGYETYDYSLPKKCRIIENAEKYISAHKEISDKYIHMMKKSETESCVSLINEIINSSDINTDFIKPSHVDLAYTAIMNCIMDDIDRRVKAELVSALETIKEWYHDEQK